MVMQKRSLESVSGGRISIIVDASGVSHVNVMADTPDRYRASRELASFLENEIDRIQARMHELEAVE